MRIFDRLSRRAPELQCRYPNDPLTKILTAVYDVDSGREIQGELILRAAMSQPTPQRPWSEQSLHPTAQGLLALLMK